MYLWTWCFVLQKAPKSFKGFEWFGWWAGGWSGDQTNHKCPCSMKQLWLTFRVIVDWRVDGPLMWVGDCGWQNPCGWLEGFCWFGWLAGGLSGVKPTMSVLALWNNYGWLLGWLLIGGWMVSGCGLAIVDDNIHVVDLRVFVDLGGWWIVDQTIFGWSLGWFFNWRVGWSVDGLVSGWSNQQWLTFRSICWFEWWMVSEWLASRQLHEGEGENTGGEVSY